VDVDPTEDPTDEPDDSDDVLNYVGPETGGMAVPYLPLGICLLTDQFSYVFDCDNDEPMQNVYANTNCGGIPIFTQSLDDSFGNESSNFEAECNTDVDCTYALIEIINTNNQSVCDPTSVTEQAVMVGTCAYNGVNSFIVVCDESTVLRSTYDSDDCSGTVVDTTDVIDEFSDSGCGGNVVACYMTEPTTSSPTTAAPTTPAPTTPAPSSDSDDLTSTTSDSEDPIDNNSGASKMQMGMVLTAALIGSLFV